MCMNRIKVTLLLGMGAAWCILVAGCANGNGKQEDKSPPPLQLVRFDDPVRPTPVIGPVQLRAARNETVEFALQINKLPPTRDKKPPLLRLQPLTAQGGGIINVASIAAWQVLAVPMDTNRAGFVRHTGLNATADRLPRALLPLKLDNGAIDIS